MRLAIVHHQLNHKGGMETYLHDLIREFIKQDASITTFIYKKLAQSYPKEIDVNKTYLSYLPRPLRKLVFGWNIHKKITPNCFDQSICLIRAINQDLLICGGTHLGYLTHINKKPTLLDLAEIKLETKSYQTAKKIIAHSSLLVDELVNHYQVSKDKIIKIFPPVDVHTYNQAEKNNKIAIKKAYGISPDKTAILFPSTSHRRKGLRPLLQALELLSPNDYELIIVGDPLTIAPTSNVKALGYVTDMRQLYTACDVTILPSYYEPFGLVVLESLQCGTPVIVSEFVGAKDLITSNEGIILEALTPAAIAQALELMRTSYYSISNNFAQSKELTVAQHVTQLKSNFS